MAKHYAGAAAVSESEGGVSAPSSRPTVARLCDVVEATFLKGRLAEGTTHRRAGRSTTLAYVTDLRGTPTSEDAVAQVVRLI
jgi:hypothetical protein